MEILAIAWGWKMKIGLAIWFMSVVAMLSAGWWEHRMNPICHQCGDGAYSERLSFFSPLGECELHGQFRVQPYQPSFVKKPLH